MNLKIKFNPEYFVFKYLWMLLLIQSDVYVFIAILFNFLFLFSKYKIKFSSKNSKYIYYSFIWCSISTISIMINYIIIKPGYDRLFADWFNPFIWLLGFLYAHIYSEIQIDYKKVKYYSFFNIVVFILILFIYLFVYNYNVVFLNRNLSSIDILSNSVSRRFVGFQIYATINATLSIASIPLILSLIKNEYLKILLLIIILLPTYFSGSRIGTICIIIIILYLIYKVFPIKIRLIFMCIFIILSIYNYYYIAEYIYSIYNIRNSSNLGRFIIYSESINKVLNNNFILGYGISDISSSGTWLGSHSTYISFFYKSGLLGMPFIVLSFYYLFKKIFFVNNKYSIIYIISILIFFIFETLDPQVIILIYYFINVGILSNSKEVVYNG